MALLIHPPIKPVKNSTPSAPASCSSSSSRSVICIRRANNIHSSLKRQQLKETTSSPLRKAEEMASRLGLEVAIADLERLFWQPTSDPPTAPGSPGRPIRVAYQGARGSYCQEAAARAFPSLQLASCSRMEDAFTALEDLSADRAVVPAENSIDGPIDRNFDLLLRHEGVRIVGELLLPVDHCLLALPGAPRSGLRRIVSHPQALSHCRHRLEALGLEVCEVSCSADAARIVAEESIADTAVIGSKIAAREFGLRVVEQNFQDHRGCGNFNRFLQLALGPSSGPAGGGSSKTTVAFSLEEGVSDLYWALRVFESRGLRVGRVDHRPNRSNPFRVVERPGFGEVMTYFDYVFLVDVVGSLSDPGVKAAVERLRERAGFVRVLGSYTCTSEMRP